MEFTKQFSGKYYMNRRTCKKIFRDWWLIKADTDNKKGYISGSHKIYFPEELIGKKVRIVIEILEEKENGFQKEKTNGRI